MLPVLLRLPPGVEALDSVVGGSVLAADLAVSRLLVVDAVDGDETASNASASLVEQR